MANRGAVIPEHQQREPIPREREVPAHAEFDAKLGCYVRPPALPADFACKTPRHETRFPRSNGLRRFDVIDLATGYRLAQVRADTIAQVQSLKAMWAVRNGCTPNEFEVRCA
jgi:hypothetical protein